MSSLLSTAEPLASGSEEAAVSTPPESEAFSPNALLSGASALIVATGAERGFGFLANLLAARFGGASIFGGYSLAMTTANNIAAYAGAGIGATATRFSGECPEGSPQASVVQRALIMVSTASAVLASLILLVGASPLARLLLRQPRLASLLQWAALSAGMMILLECCRGFLIGQRKLTGLLLLSGVMGTGMVVLLPFASRFGSVPMICTQVLVATVAITSVVIAYRTPRASAVKIGREDVVRMARRVWSFGFVQLLGVLGLNAAGWWIASVVARADQSLVEMGIFAVANQVRNVVALIPGLLTQSSFALMANDEESPARVLVFCSLLATLLVLGFAGFGIVICPVLIPLVWGHAYAGGVLASSLAFATAIVHMAGSAPAARLTILSLPLTGVINGIWAAVVVALSAVLSGGFQAGTAAAVASAIYLAAHLLSSTLVLGALLRLRSAPSGLIPLFLVANGTALLLALFAVWQTRLSGSRVFAIAGIELLVVLGGLWAVILVAKREGFSLQVLLQPVHQMRNRFLGRFA